MQECNIAPTPPEANIKLVKDADEVSIDNTLFKQIIGSLRYVCHSMPDI